MRPIHVVVLLLSGALGGAMIMRVVHPTKPVVPVAMVAQPQPPATAPPEQPEPVAQTPPAAEPGPQPIVVAEPVKPSPMPRAKREIPKAQPARAVASIATASPAPAAPAPGEDPVPIPVPTSPTIVPPPVSTVPEQVAPAPPEVTAAPVPQPHQVTLNAGLVLPVRLVDGLSSERNVPGDTFVATLDKEVVADGFVIAERGARVEGRVVAVDRAKVRAAAALALELTTLHTSDRQTVPIRTEGFFKHANAGQVDNATKIAGGAGVGDVLPTHRPAELASESLVTFTLKSAVPLTERQ